MMWLGGSLEQLLEGGREVSPAEEAVVVARRGPPRKMASVVRPVKLGQSSVAMLLVPSAGL